MSSLSHIQILSLFEEITNEVRQYQYSRRLQRTHIHRILVYSRQSRSILLKVLEDPFLSDTFKQLLTETRNQLVQASQRYFSEAIRIRQQQILDLST